MKYRVGNLLLLSQGEYSDYGINALVRVIKDFDAREVMISYPGKKDDYNFREAEFINFLIKQGYVEDVDYQEWYLGSYGTMEIPEDKDNVTQA